MRRVESIWKMKMWISKWSDAEVDLGDLIRLLVKKINEVEQNKSNE